jgi:hypothetical protein
MPDQLPGWLGLDKSSQSGTAFLPVQRRFATNRTGKAKPFVAFIHSKR